MLKTQLASRPAVVGVYHYLEIEAVAEGTEFAQRIDALCNEQDASQPEIRCHICGAMMALPQGSIKAYLQTHLTELGGESAFVELLFRHRGPKPASPPAGINILSRE